MEKHWRLVENQTLPLQSNYMRSPIVQEQLPSSGLNTRTIESISGLSAGFISTLVAHPLDFFKLRLQLDTQSRSQLDAFKKIRNDLMKDSLTTNNRISYTKLLQNVYRGVGPNLLGSTTAWGLYFMFYREYKNALISYKHQDFALTVPGRHKNNDSSLSGMDYLGCGFLAGWTTSLLTNPIWVIKTRMISTSRRTPGAYSSIMDGIKQIYLKEGFKGYYKGLSPALISVSQGAIQLSIYDSIKKHLKGDDRELSTVEYLYASGVSKMLSTLMLYPLQVVRTRLQNSTTNQVSLLKLAQTMLREEQLAGFYKGVVAQLLRVVPATCITFVAYENVKKALS